MVSSRLGLSEAKIYSVATFYENFSLEPKGRVIIKVCDGTACHVRRSPPILARLRQELGLKEGSKTSSDLEFTVETVACLGACGLAPVMTVGEKVYPGMTPDKASEIVAAIRRENTERIEKASGAALAAEELKSLDEGELSAGFASSDAAQLQDSARLQDAARQQDAARSSDMPGEEGGHA